MICPKCHKEVADNVKYCSLCGYELSVSAPTPKIKCPNCLAFVDADKSTCPRCNHVLNPIQSRSEKQHITYTRQPIPTPNYVPKKGVGFALGFFFGIFGLIALLLLYPYNSSERSTAINGWVISLVTSIVVAIIAVLMITCAAQNLGSRYY